MSYLLCAIFFEDPVETLIDELNKIGDLFSQTNIKVKFLIYILKNLSYSSAFSINNDLFRTVPEEVKIFSETKKYSLELNYALQDSLYYWVIFTYEKQRIEPEKYSSLLKHIDSGYEIIVLGRENPEKTKRINKETNKNYDFASTLTRLVFPDVHTPLSKNFMIRPEVLHQIPLDIKSNLLLEILAKGRWKKVLDIPYKTVKEDPTNSYAVEIGKTTFQLTQLFIYSLSHRDSGVWNESIYAIKFGLVGISGVIVNMGLLYGLTEYAGMYYLYSSIIAIEASILNNFIWNEIWTFRKKESTRVVAWWKRLVSYHIFSIVGIVLNITLLYVLTEKFGIYYLLSNVIGIVAIFLWNYIVNRRVTWRSI